MEQSFYDVIVIGVGAMGSSALYHLSKIPNLKILGIDQFHPPHTFGSSHGETRITRQIYFEHPDYVPLLKKSYPMWRQLENETNTKLFESTGGIYIGQNGHPLLNGLKETAKKHNFNIKLMTPKEIMEKFPAFKIPDHMVGIYDNTAGILFPEKCIDAFVSEAKKKGAVMNFGEKMISVKTVGDFQQVITTKSTYLCKKLIISAGAYVINLLKDEEIPIKLRIERKKLFWMEPKKGYKKDFLPDKLPIFLLHDEKKQIIFYGFPDIIGTGVKAAIHVNKDDSVTDVYNLDRKVSETEIKEFEEKISIFMPNIFGKLNKTDVCLYTMTPDEHFIIDFLPKNKNIILASPCSGHGFKFSVIIGEILKDLALKGKSEFDLSLFSLQRKLESQPKL